MSTSDTYSNFNTQELITKSILKTKFFDYLKKKSIESLSQIYSKQGSLSTAIQVSHVDTDYLNTTATLVGTNLATDGFGNFFDIDSSFAYCSSFPIHATGQNQTFDIGLKYVTGVSFGISGDVGVMTNTQSNIVQYTGTREYIGEKGNPNSVTLVGSDIKLNVNNLCQSAISASGRQCLVYLTNPVSTVEAIAIQVLTIAWDGTNNTVTVVSNKLGQTSPSVTVGDYQCIVLGPTIRDQNSLSLNNLSPYFYVGSIRSGTVSSPVWTVDTTKQNVYEVDFDKISETVDKINKTVTVNYAGKTQVPGVKLNPSTLFTNATGVSYGNNIYIFGGATHSSLNATTTNVQKFNVDVNTWSTLGTAFPDAFSINAVCAKIGNKAYIFGGKNSLGTTTGNLRIFNLELETWSSGATCPVAMENAEWEVVDNETAILFGVSGNRYKYTVASNTWATTASVGSNTTNYAPLLMNDGLKISFASDGVLFPTITITNTIDGSTASFPNLFPAVITGATYIMNNGIVYIFGGVDIKSNSTITPTSNWINDYYYAIDTNYVFRAHKNCVATIEPITDFTIGSQYTVRTVTNSFPIKTWDNSLVVSNATTATTKYMDIPYYGLHFRYITNASNTNKSTYILIISTEDDFMYAKSKKTNIVADNKGPPTNYYSKVNNINVTTFDGWRTTIPEDDLVTADNNGIIFYWKTYDNTYTNFNNPFKLTAFENFYHYPQNTLFNLNDNTYITNQVYGPYSFEYQKRLKNYTPKSDIYDLDVLTLGATPNFTIKSKITPSTKNIQIRFRVFNTGLITRRFFCKTKDPDLLAPQQIAISKNQIYGDLIMSTQWDYSYNVIGDY